MLHLMAGSLHAGMLSASPGLHTQDDMETESKVNLGEHVRRISCPRKDDRTEYGATNNSAHPLCPPSHATHRMPRAPWQVLRALFVKHPRQIEPAAPNAEDATDAERHLAQLPPPYELPVELPVLIKSQDGRVHLHKKITEVCNRAFFQPLFLKKRIV